jgi:hypothetical protein
MKTTVSSDVPICSLKKRLQKVERSHIAGSSSHGPLIDDLPNINMVIFQNLSQFFLEDILINPKYTN